METDSRKHTICDVMKNPYTIAVSCIYALGMMIGYSYYTTESWNLLYDGTLIRSVLALLVFVALSLAFLAVIALGGWILSKNPRILHREAHGKLESLLFEKHSFLAPLIVLSLCTLPVVILFFPGTVAPDARGQLYSYFAPWEMNGHQPIGSTLVMGGFVELGRILFDSDSIGLFLFTGTQTILQLLVQAYIVHYQKRLQSPFIIRWMTLAYFGVLPLFQIWGFTVIKDSIYYIAFALLVLSMLDYFRQERRGASAVFLTIAALMIVVFRKEGKYIVFVSLLLLFFVAKKHWQDFCIAAVACVGALFLIEGVYMPMNGIKDGPVKEMLSLPLQQTGRYLWLHGEEITDEEREALEAVFVPELPQVGYVKETSDCVKGFFEDYPDGQALKNYFKVWYRQGLKHPATYLQATLNQTYGYFYPPRGDIRDEIGYFGFSFDTAMYMDRDNVSASFAIENGKGREAFKQYMEGAYRLPLLGGLYRAGTHTFLLLGMAAYLLSRRQYKKTLLFIPSLMILLVAIASPLNASIRYMLPIMMVLPIHLSICTERK